MLISIHKLPKAAPIGAAFLLLFFFNALRHFEQFIAEHILRMKMIHNMTLRVCPGDIAVCRNAKHAIDLNFLTDRLEFIAGYMEGADRFCIVRKSILLRDSVGLVFKVNFGIFDPFPQWDSQTGPNINL